MPKADSKYPAVLTVIILALAAYLGVLFGNPYWRYIKFQQDITNIVNWDKFKELHPPTIDEARRDVLAAAKRLGIPLKKKYVKVTKLPNGGVDVKVKYREKIDIPLYGTYVWPFKIHKKDGDK